MTLNNELCLSYTAIPEQPLNIIFLIAHAHDILDDCVVACTGRVTLLVARAHDILGICNVNLHWQSLGTHLHVVVQQPDGALLPQKQYSNLMMKGDSRRLQHT